MGGTEFLPEGTRGSVAETGCGGPRDHLSLTDSLLHEQRQFTSFTEVSELGLCPLSGSFPDAWLAGVLAIFKFVILHQ